MKHTFPLAEATKAILRMEYLNPHLIKDVTEKKYSTFEGLNLGNEQLKTTIQKKIVIQEKVNDTISELRSRMILTI